MVDFDSLKAKVIEELTDFRRSLERSEDNKYRLKKENWEKFYCILDKWLEHPRHKWFDGFVELVCKEINREKIIFPAIPQKAEIALNAFQITQIAMCLMAIGVIEADEFNKFIWLYFKTISPDDACVCRGYVSRYMDERERSFEKLSHDMYKHILEKEQFPLVEKSQSLRDKAEEFAVKLAGFAIFSFQDQSQVIDTGLQE
ncbi:MAG: hypothetical protein ABFD91_16310 [Anaerohalosphaeraceae bacterium]